MAEPMRPVIFGEVLFDCFPDGESRLGGAPFNVAWHLQALGDAPLLISRVGSDAHGDQILASMQRWGMDVAGLQRDHTHPSGRVEVSLEAGEPHYRIQPDCAYDFISVEGLPSLTGATLLYHGSLGLRSASAADALDRLAAKPGVSVFVDVNLRDPWWQREAVLAGLSRAHWAKLNVAELSLLAPPAEGDDARARALLVECGLSLLVVTHGAAGAVAYRADGECLRVAPPPEVTVVDTVGAGDAFSAVLIHGLIHAWPLRQTLERAQWLASAVVGVRGALPDSIEFYLAVRG